ncbi:MAG TPA: hypothetical protein DD640_08260 [Clostridiales bacterium]|nr:hypothetical protein [Clostridiales bacterium]
MPYPLIDEMAGAYLSVQGRLIRADDPEAAPLFLPSDPVMYYEVVRVTRGVPLFWEDHLARLARSVRGALPIPESLYAESVRLIAACGLVSANLKLILTEQLRVIHLTTSYYPGPQQIQAGVPTGILTWEREDPNTKIIRADYKAAVAARFARPGPFGPCFEVLLADRRGFLTEGSRSNLFFIRGSRVLSAPDSRILLGITRKHVHQALQAAGTILEEGLLTLGDIRSDDGITAFLTASPIDILPINAIEDIRLNSAENPLLRRIHAAYQAIVEEYVAGRLARIRRNMPESAQSGTSASNGSINKTTAFEEE